MLTVVMLLAVSASPGAARAPSLAIPGLNAVKLAPGEGELYSESLAQHLIALGLKVMSARDIAAVLGNDRQKLMMGCSEESCVAELAAALGADALVVGDVGNLGDQYVLNLKVVSARNAAPLAIFSAKPQSSRELTATLERAAESLAEQLGIKVRRRQTAGFSKAWALVPTAVGVASFAVAGAMWAQAGTSYSKTQSAGSLDEAASARDLGKQQQTLGWVAAGVGSAALVCAVVVAVMGGERTLQPSLTVGSNGAALSVSGAF